MDSVVYCAGLTFTANVRNQCASLHALLLGDKQYHVVPAVDAAEQLVAGTAHGAAHVRHAADYAVLAQSEAAQPQQPTQLLPAEPQEAERRLVPVQRADVNPDAPRREKIPRDAYSRGGVCEGVDEIACDLTRRSVAEEGGG